VGVVRPIRLNDLAATAREQIYIAHHQSPQRTMYPTVRVAGDPLAILPDVRRIVRELEPNLPIIDVGLATDHLVRATARTRFALVALAGLAWLAVALTAGGVYASMAFLAGQRRREIGIRLAIGAVPRSIRWLITWQGAGLVAGGLGLGIVGALGATRLASGLLFGVSATDALTFAAVAAGSRPSRWRRA
jgi:hypothetical protein